MKDIGFKEAAFLVVAIIAFALMFLINGNQAQDFQQCADTANAKYASIKPVPQGQPYTDIYGCMRAAGYELETQSNQTLVCSGLDYTVSLMNQQCYRPTNPIKCYVHDLKLTFR